MYRTELIWPAAAIGAVFLLMLPFVAAMLAVVVVVVVAVAIPVGLVGAIAAVPLLVIRTVRRHRRNGRSRPVYIEQMEMGKAPSLRAAGAQAAVSQAPAPAR
jgi:membrane protein implicated in regulation of membrane protease activity